MRGRTVKYGIRLIAGGITSVILATFFHEQLASVLLLSRSGEVQFIFLGLLCGAILSFSGILVVAAGFFIAPGAGTQPRLLPSLLILIVLIVLFFVLVFFPVGPVREPRIEPGHTVII